MHEAGTVESSWREALRRPSSIALLVANVIPLMGVLIFGWQVFPLVLLFWFENVILGVINILKMAIAQPRTPYTLPAKLFMIPFFSIHYGMFTFVHGVFIMVIFGGGMKSGTPFPTMFGGPTSFWGALVGHHLHWAALGLAMSHFISFIFDYVRPGVYRTIALPALMSAPYGRIVVLHLTILIGGALVMFMGSPMVGLLLLVVLKTGLDLRALLKSTHPASAPAGAETNSAG